MTVLSIALKGALVLSLAGVAAYLLRSAPAAARHAVWVAAFVALLAVPVLAAFGPSLELRVLPSAFAQQVAPVAPDAPVAPPAPPAPLPEVPAPAPAPPLPPIAPMMGPIGAPLLMDAPPPPAPPALPAAPAPPAPAPLAVPVEPALAPAAPRRSLVPPVLTRLGPSGWLASLWAGGALLVLLGWAVPLLAARHLVSRAHPETSSPWLDALEHARLLSAVEGPVRLLRSDRLDVPVAWGWGAPAVVLPSNADEWAEDRREAVLLHELAHLSRGDAQTQLLAQLAVALHWFNPLAWWAYGRMLEEREHACDDAVLRGGARPSAYAGHLVDIARGLRRRPAALAAFAPMARSSRLESRVLSILSDHQRAALPRLRMAGFIGVSLALALPLGACQLTSRTASAQAPPSPPAAPQAPAAPAPAPAPRLASAPQVAESALADTRAALAEVERDLESRIAPEMEAARARLAELRDQNGAFADVDWDEMEAEMETALAEVEIDMEEAMADAFEALEEADWEGEVESSLREAQQERERALEALRRELATVEREVEREVERAQRDATRARTGSLQDRQREADRARARAEEHRQREAERESRAREQRQREIERNRQREDRQREDRRREPAQASRETASLASFRGPTAPPAGYSYAVTTDGQQTVVVAGNGPGAWAASLEGWTIGVDALASQIGSVENDRDLQSLRQSLTQMERGLDGIERSARGWAESATESRIVTRSVAEARAALADAVRGLNKSATCDD